MPKQIQDLCLIAAELYNTWINYENCVIADIANLIVGFECQWLYIDAKNRPAKVTTDTRSTIPVSAFSCSQHTKASVHAW
ncbi:MAG: hypothetical protein HY665_01165 [Chloroflexi bacterium]|nr:hypothetical protein [Chloroflexota bacterium]